MANDCVPTRGRTKWLKCSVSRGFQCGLWVWCAAVCLQLGAADREPLSMAVTKSSDCVRYGDDLEIFCTTEGPLNASDLFFTLNDKRLPSTIVNSTTIRLYEPKPKEAYKLVYYCRSRTKKTTNLAVCIASPPAEVKDFECVSKNIEMLNCSWTTPDMTIFTNYSLTFYTNGNPVKPCIAKVVSGTPRRYCYWNTTSVPRYREQEEKYYFTLLAKNTFEVKKQNFTVDHFSVVKPDPPQKLKIINKTAHSVMLQWQLPFKILDFLPDGVETKVEYQIAKIDDPTKFRHVDTSSLPDRNKTYNFNLTNLPYAHMKYGVRVYIKPHRAERDEFWSDFSNIVFNTESETPKRPPAITAGAFTQSVFEGHRMMYIYWQQLEEYEEAGANFTYKVVVYQGSTDPTEYHPDKGKSLGFLYLGNATSDQMEVHIWSKNEIGKSENHSYLYIPPERETRSLSLSSFTKLAFENGTYELSWVGIDNIDNYTLFWCHHNVTNICTGRVNFTVLDHNKNRHIIDLPRDYRYQFAISANNGTRTSGMVWANCDISRDGIAMYAFPIRFMDHDAPGKTFVRLKWSMDCTLKDDTIQGYNITYCSVIRTSTKCENATIEKIVNDPKQMDTNITNLEPYKTYQFMMSLLTKYGVKNIENATIYITTLEDKPTIPRHVAISDVTNTSLRISWDPPLHLNGHISKIKYEIYNFGTKFREISYDDSKSSNTKSRNEVLLDGLNSFTNYSLTMTACNEGIHVDNCSVQTKPIFLRTTIGRPSQMSPPEYENNQLSWTPPAIPGGTVDQYQIRIVRDDHVQILNTTDLSHPVTSCEGTVQNETYQVRALNFDNDLNHGAVAGTENVAIPVRNDEALLIFAGEWSKESLVLCRNRMSMLVLYIIMGVLGMVAMGFGVVKMSIIYKDMKKGLKPIVPPLLLQPDPNNKPTKEEKPPKSDEMLLLPNSKAAVPPQTTVDKRRSDNINCGSSDNTDSTALTDDSQGPIDRQNSTSDDDSHSSLQSGGKTAKTSDVSPSDKDSSSTDTDGSKENSPYFSNNAFKKDIATGYVQPLISAVSGGPVQSSPMSVKPPPKPPAALAGSSYVLAGLPPGAFPPPAARPAPAAGYVRAEDAQPRPLMLYPKLGSGPPLSMPPLPPPKPSEDSHIQLQSLDAFPSHKPSARHLVPLKAPASSGYVTAVELAKHLGAGAAPPGDEAAILDPAMSRDAYCRFSWSTDPANDNLHSLLANTPTINSKNPVNH